jgi:tRNA-splicing ligase RtcB
MSTIKTFGDVDARSLEQLERCMEAGDAAFGVLCADHHPGYSQPIGGGQHTLRPLGVAMAGRDVHDPYRD